MDSFTEFSGDFSKIEGSRDGIIQLIYAACDSQGTNAVPVQDLVNYITPYFQNCIDKLEELRKSLDPHGANPSVTFEAFQEQMTKWIDELENKNVTSEEISISPKAQVFSPSALHSSTPRSSLRPVADLDLSNMSSTNECGNSFNYSVERTLYEDKIKQLEFEAGKANNELRSVKQQLNMCEENNIQLQAELEMVNKRFVAEKQASETSHINKKEIDDLKEELSKAKKYIETLEKNSAELERNNRGLKDSLKDLEKEKLKVDQMLERVLKRESDLKTECHQLQRDMMLKEEEITGMQCSTNLLGCQVAEQEDLIDHLRKSVELLRDQKSKLEKALRDQCLGRIDRKSLLNKSRDVPTSVGMLCLQNSLRRSLSSPETNPNGEGLLNKTNSLSSLPTFNTPNLIRQLANPITPRLGPSSCDSPISGSVYSGVKSVDSPLNVLSNYVPLGKSTPKENEDRLILDCSISLNGNLAPVMRFTTSDDSISNAEVAEDNDEIGEKNLIENRNCNGDSLTRLSVNGDVDSARPEALITNIMDYRGGSSKNERDVRSGDDSEQVCSEYGTAFLNAANTSSDEDFFGKIPIASLCSKAPHDSLEVEILNAHGGDAYLRPDFSVEGQAQELGKYTASEVCQMLKEHGSCTFIQEAYKKQLSEYLTLQTNLKKDLENKSHTINNLNIEIEKLTSLKNSLYVKLEEEYGKGDALKKELENRERDMAIKEQTISDLNKKVLDLTVSSDALKCSYHLLKKQFQGHDDSLKEMQVNIDNLTKDLNVKKNENMLLNKFISNLEKQKSRLEDLLNNDHESYKTKINNLESSLKERDSVVGKLQNELKSQNQAKQKLFDEKEYIEKELESIKSTLQNKEQQFKVQYEELENRRVKLENENKEQKNLINELNKEIEDFKKIEESLMLNLKDVNDKLLGARCNEMELNKRIKVLMEGNGQLELRLKSLQQDERHSNEQLKEMRSLNANLSLEVTKTKSAFDALKEENRNPNEIIDKLKSEYNRLATERFQMHSEINELKSRNTILNHEKDELNQESERFISELKKIIYEIPKDLISFGQTDTFLNENFTIFDFIPVLKMCIRDLSDKKQQAETSCQLAEIENQIKKMSEFNKSSLVKKGSFDKQQIRMEKLQEKIDYLENQLKEQQIINDVLKREAEQVKGEKEKLQTRCNELRKELSAVQRQHDVLTYQSETNNRSLIQENARAQKDLNQLRSELFEKETRWKEVENIYKSELDNFGQVREQNTCLQIHVEKLVTQLGVYEAKRINEERSNMGLRKQLNELQMFCDVKLKGLEKCLVDKNAELDSVRKELQEKSKSMECLLYLESLYEEVDNKFRQATSELKNTKEIISESRIKLEKCLDLFFDKWNDTLNRGYLREKLSLDTVLIDRTEETDKELVKLSEHLLLTCDILEHLANNASKFISGNEALPERDIVSNQGKHLKRFTICTQQLTASCTPSPDIPSETCETRENSLLDGSCDSESEKPREKGHRNQKPILPDIESQCAFPSQPDTLLDSLGLLDQSPRKPLSRKEIEDLFTTLALAFTLDSKTVKRRYDKQQLLVLKCQENLMVRLAEVIDLLKNGQTVTVVESIEEVLDSLVTIFDVVEQFGVLRYEARQVKSWNLTINYMALIKQESELLSRTAPPSIGLNETPGKKAADDVSEWINMKRFQTYTFHDSFIDSSEGRFQSMLNYRYKWHFLVVIFLIIFSLFFLPFIIQWKCIDSFVGRAAFLLDNIIEMFLKTTREGMPPM